ncbi:MAG: leucine-rich repeat protein [Firmicutes bacterium]|nr:leucine-rich repeat protein [Bacillota bacterium]
MKKFKMPALILLIAFIGALGLAACGESAPAVYEVAFDSRGGSPVAGLSQVESGTKIAKPSDPVKAGENFSGWYKEEACVNAWDFVVDTVTRNLTLYAKWVGEDGGAEDGGEAEAPACDWGEWTPLSAPTCTEAGGETRTCKDDPAHTETRAVPALGHFWDSWVLTTPPSDTTNGEETRICRRDSSHVETRVYATVELKFTLILDDAEYEVSAGGSAAGVAYIPSAYNGLPVTRIAYRGFIGGTGITGVIISDGITDIGDYAFYGCNRMTSVDIGDGATRIGERAFYSCTRLSSATIGENVLDIGAYAFYNCPELKSIKLPDGIVRIGGDAFRACAELTSITIPDTVQSIGSDAFLGCLKLVYSVSGNIKYLGNWAIEATNKNITSVTFKAGTIGIAGSAFYNCNGLANVAIPDSVLYLGYAAFSRCSALKGVTIGSGLKNIGSSAFAYSALTAVTIPDTAESVGDWAFAGCRALTAVTVGSDVTVIDRYAFYSCDWLDNITLPAGLTAIGQGAFEDCSRLKDVYYAGSQAQWSAISGLTTVVIFAYVTVHYDHEP